MSIFSVPNPPPEHPVAIPLNNQPRPACIAELVSIQAVSSPHAVAVSDTQRTLNYRELNARANELAQHLRALGVGPNVIVGLGCHARWPWL